MASIQGIFQGILNPSSETIDPQLEQRALIDQSVVAPETSSWAKREFWDTVQSNPFYNLLGAGISYGEPKQTQEQLEVIHPDMPERFFEGGATAFQAEMIVDKHNQKLQTEEMRQFLLGDNPDWIDSSSMWTMGAAIDLAGGLTDPLVLSIFGRAGQLANVLKAPLTSIAPTYMAKIAGSRAASLFGHELAVNVIGETAAMYPLKKAVLDEYTRGEETTLIGTVEGAIGSAVAFAGLKYVGGGLFGAAKNSGKEFVNKLREDNFLKLKDKSNAHINSESANEAIFKEAAAHTVSAEMGSPLSSVSERMSAKAFTGERNIVFNTAKAFTGVFEKTSGKSDYLGERFGDTHVFSSDPNATQGMFDSIAKDGNNYEIYGHDGNIKTIDLDNEIILDHQEILDIIENPLNMGVGFLDKITDESTLAQVFKEINNYAKENGMSGKDTVEMFNEINKVFKADGIEGTIHTEEMGKTKHSVLSIFDDALKGEHLEKVHEGQSDNPINPTPEEQTNLRTTEDVNLGEGKTIPMEDSIPEDDYYDGDPALELDIKFWNSPEFESIPHVTDEIPDMVKNIKEKLEDVFAEVKQSQSLSKIIAIQERFHGSDKLFEQFKDDFAGHRNGAVIGRGHYFGKKNLATSFSSGGFLYESTIPDIANLIEADKFITNQSPEIKIKIEKMFEKNPELDSFIQSKLKIDFSTREEILGLQLYELTRDFLVQEGGNPSTSGEIQAGKFLADNGIKGATWLYDQPNEHTVIYNAEDIKIKSINEIELEKIQEEIDAVKKEYADNSPEQENEVAKAIENCLRKH
jgi:hypothetical protein